MALKWDEITKENILSAIKNFENSNIRYPKAKNTFLLYNGRKYPAKHIRFLAYKIAFEDEITKEMFSGGIETVHFFEKLGFEMIYKKDSILKLEKTTKIIKTSAKHTRKNITCKDVVEQKNSLQLVLNKYFNGDIVCEKTFNWLKTPCKGDPTYKNLVTAITNYRNYNNFDKQNLKLRCDFVCEGKKIIIEYDERQHFTLARKIALENYPLNTKIYFNKQKWIDTCISTNARDNNPINRDEIRAYYDSIRDIKSSENGYILLRIIHGSFDWKREDAFQEIDAMVKGIINKNGNYQYETSAYNLFREFEIQLQRIRVNYLKWLYFYMPDHNLVLDYCFDGSDFKVIDSYFGRSFTLSPAGYGSIYIGGKGCLKLPDHNYMKSKELEIETINVKKSLNDLNKKIVTLTMDELTNNRLHIVWKYIQDFWWIRLGIHEYAFDMKIEWNENIPSQNNIRDYVLNALNNKIDLSIHIPDFSKEELIAFIKNKFKWARYGCCSYDCGPILWGNEKFVSYSDIALKLKQKAKSNGGLLSNLHCNSNDDIKVKRKFAIETLCDEYFIGAEYHKPPLDFCYFNDFLNRKDKIYHLISNIQERLNELVKFEKLSIPAYCYLPYNNYCYMV